MKKKKGSSLIFVLVTLAVIATFGFSVLSLTLMSYKKRLTEVNEKRNQYFSESGIDIAYGIIGKTVDSAIVAGNRAVDAELDNINKASKNELEPVERNEEYKKYLKSDGSLDKEKVDEAMKKLFWDKYKEHIENNLVGNISDRSLYDVGEGKRGRSNDTPKVKVTNKDGNELVKLEDDPKQIKLSFTSDGDNDNNTLSVYLKSEFSSNRKSDDINSGQIQKTISVTYVIGPSKYEKPITQRIESGKIVMTDVWKKAISTDGNFTVEGDLDVTGDVYAKGKDDGGIVVLGGKSTIKGILATSENLKFNASNNIDFTVKGNVYAENLSLTSQGANANILGKPLSFKVEPFSREGGNLFGAIYTNNDLELSGSNISVDTKYFYGINNITEEAPSSNVKPRSSSSILINTDESGVKNSVNIEDKALFMGVAYIQTKPDEYPTGESVSVKGNYKAYMQYLKEGKFKEGNVSFQYYSPLVLATAYKDENGIEKIMDSNDKSDYIQEYIKEFKSDFEKWKEKASIILPDISNILSIGAYADDTKIDAKSYQSQNVENHEAFLRVKKAKYSRIVYSMKSEHDVEEDDEFNKTYAPEELSKKSDGFDNYVSNNLEVRDTSKNKTVSGEIPFTSITQTINKTVTHRSKDSYAGKWDAIYLNGDENNPVYIKGEGGIVPPGKDYIDTTKVQGGVVITKGEVHLTGNVSFRGTIISGRSIDSDDLNTKTIIYDGNYINEIVANNGSDFSQIAIKDSNSQDAIEYSTVIDYSPQQGNGTTDVIRNAGIIKLHNWRILK